MVALTAGQWHERPQEIPLLEQGLERMWPEAVAGDRGYSASELRNWLQQRDVEAVIPYREDEMGEHAYDRERPIIERAINRLKRYRRIATRSDKLARSYLAMVPIACILEWL